MNKGYLIQANTEKEILQARLLCDSIKTRNKDASVSLVTKLSESYEGYDNVIDYKMVLLISI